MRYPDIRVKLRTANPLALVSAVRMELRRAGVRPEEIHRFSDEAMTAANDRDRLIQVCSEWVDATRPDE